MWSASDVGLEAWFMTSSLRPMPMDVASNPWQAPPKARGSRDATSMLRLPLVCELAWREAAGTVTAASQACARRTSYEWSPVGEA